MSSTSPRRSPPTTSALACDARPDHRADRRGRRRVASRALRRGRRDERRPGRDDRRLRRDRDPLGDEADRGRSRARRPAQGDRPSRRRRRQRRRRDGHATRNRRRQRTGIDRRLRRRAHDRPARRTLAQHPAGARGLGLRVVAYDPFVAKERFRELGVERVESPTDVYSASDFLTLHLPLTDETRGSVDGAAFGAMKDGVRLINAARGELVDEDALLEALRSGKVGAAALDVFPAEPYQGPLLELDNVVVTPHLAASTEEAQDRAGVIVAEQVAAALDGALVTNAVNIPAIRAEDLEALGPFVPLAAKLGRLAMAFADGRAERISLAYYGGLSGYDTRLLTVAALNGAFQGRAETPVNYVNAPLIAAERGIEVLEERRRACRDFQNLLRVGVRANGDLVRVAGTTIGNDHRHWLVSALGFELEMELAPLLVFFRYDDVPGVIGQIGSLFGEAGVNIANMAVSRTRRGGKALMALSIDSPAPPELVDRVRREGFDEVRFVTLGGAQDG